MVATTMARRSIIMYFLFYNRLYTTKESLHCILYQYATLWLWHKEITAKQIFVVKSAPYNYKVEIWTSSGRKITRFSCSVPHTFGLHASFPRSGNYIRCTNQCTEWDQGTSLSLSCAKKARLLWIRQFSSEPGGRDRHQSRPDYISVVCTHKF